MRRELEDAFKLELLEFDDCVTSGRAPLAAGIDGLHAVTLCAAIARATASGGHVSAPSATPSLEPDTEELKR